MEKPVATIANRVSTFYTHDINIAYNRDKNKPLRDGKFYRNPNLHYHQLILDKTFQSLRGARIAFAKLSRKKAWKEDVFPEWSEFYEPEDNWSKKITDPFESSTTITNKNHKK